MSINDSREYLKGILTTGVTATIDDGATPAAILVFYRGGPENFRWLFHVNDFDAVISVDREIERDSGPQRRILDVPIRYEGDVPISVMAVDKSGVTATKLLNKVRRSIIAAVEAAAPGVRATITVRQDRPQNQVMGGYDPMWQDSYLVQFRPLSTEG